MKLKLLLGVSVAAFLAAISAAAVVAQEEVPPPYAGLKNPFKWDDPDVQASGKNVYKQSCLGCHGVKGSNLAQFDFSKLEYAAGLEGRPDYYFWVLSEGRMSQGMPGYKASLSEEQRWHLLTYMRSLGRQAASPPAVYP